MSVVLLLLSRAVVVVTQRVGEDIMANTDHNGNGSVMKDVERGSYNGDNASHEEKLRNALTNTMTLSPELFEKIYLSPKGDTKGDLRKTFANPVCVQNHAEKYFRSSMS